MEGEVLEEADSWVGVEGLEEVADSLVEVAGQLVEEASLVGVAVLEEQSSEAAAEC